MALKVSVLGSGSRGNATFVKTDRVRLLIDAGLSRKEIGKRLESLGEDPNGIDGTLRALRTQDYELSGSNIFEVRADFSFTIGDAEVLPFNVPHDAVEPVAFS